MAEATAYVTLRAGRPLPLPGRAYTLLGRAYRLRGVRIVPGEPEQLRRWFPEMQLRDGDRVLYVRLTGVPAAGDESTVARRRGSA